MDQGGRDVEDVKCGIANAVVQHEPRLTKLARSTVVGELARLVIGGQHGILFDVPIVDPLLDELVVCRNLSTILTVNKS